MINLLRFYLYWSVLWGFLAHPVFGIKEIVSQLIIAVDLTVMGAASAYSVFSLFDKKTLYLQSRVRKSLLASFILIAYGIAITKIMDGSITDAIVYLAVLIRPIILLLGFAISLSYPKTQPVKDTYENLKIDMGILVCIQMSIGILQIAFPSIGGQFVVSLKDTQSAIWAFEEGDISGTFPNSIDMAYFLISGYFVLTLQNWFIRKRPSLGMTSLFGYFIYNTGSVTAIICFLLYVTFIYGRSLTYQNILYLSNFIALLLISVTISLSGLVWMGLVEFSSITIPINDKIDNMMLSRLGLIFISIPAVIATIPWRLLIGCGPDFNAVLSILNSLPDVPLGLTESSSVMIINDVFWIALILSLGVPMTIFYLYHLVVLFKSCYINYTNSTKNLINIILVIIFVAGFFNQILLVRPFVISIILGFSSITLKALNSKDKQAE